MIILSYACRVYNYRRLIGPSLLSSLNYEIERCFAAPRLADHAKGPDCVLPAKGTLRDQYVLEMGLEIVTEDVRMREQTKIERA